MATQRTYASASLEAHSKLAKRKWLGVTVDGTSAKNFINGEFRESKATTFYDVHDPATQQVVTRVPQTTPEELREAIESSAQAFKTWKNTSLFKRQGIMLK
jgi:malonate-semialdehyde dehydrogenase (acetylating)/methylmalonate-semialdehyde dehydrogenase